MPTPKQMEKMAALVRKNVPRERGLAPDDDLPQEYWQALLDDPRADGPGRGDGEERIRGQEIEAHATRVADVGADPRGNHGREDSRASIEDQAG